MRRARIQEKRQTRKGLLLFIASIGLLLALIFFGIPTLVKFAVFISDLRSSTEPITLEDKTPPAPPTINQLPAYTQADTIKISGRAEAGSTLKLFLNGEVAKETLVDETSKYSLETGLQKGENIIWAQNIDNAGNESEISPRQKVIQDNEAPSLEIISPSDGSSFYGSDKNITIEGSTEEGVKVTINERLAIVETDGKFAKNITLSEGENILEITATDPAGNKTEKRVTVNYSP